MPQYSRKLKKGVRWYYKFTFMGQTYHSRAIYHTQHEAKKAEAARFNQAENEVRNPDKKDMYLLDLINERLDYLKAAKTEKYYKENRGYLQELYNEFGNVSVKSISKADIQKLLIRNSNQMKKKDNDNYRVNASIRSFKAMFNYGIKVLELNMQNPCIGIDFFPIDKKLKYIPSDKELDDLLSKCNPEQRLLVEFVRDTGCRISEVLRVRRRDVFEGYVVLYTRKSKSGNLVPRKAEFDTSKFDLESNKHTFIFHQWKEEPKFLVRKTRKKWNWHSLRHRFASILSKNGTPLFEIMTKLGHSNLETTQRYLQLLPK